jgi:hypothetical protein
MKKIIFIKTTSNQYNSLFFLLVQKIVMVKSWRIHLLISKNYKDQNFDLLPENFQLTIETIESQHDIAKCLRFHLDFQYLVNFDDTNVICSELLPFKAKIFSKLINLKKINFISTIDQFLTLLDIKHNWEADSLNLNRLMEKEIHLINYAIIDNFNKTEFIYHNSKNTSLNDSKFEFDYNSDKFINFLKTRDLIVSSNGDLINLARSLNIVTIKILNLSEIESKNFYIDNFSADINIHLKLNKDFDELQDHQLLYNNIISEVLTKNSNLFSLRFQMFSDNIGQYCSCKEINYSISEINTHIKRYIISLLFNSFHDENIWIKNFQNLANFFNRDIDRHVSHLTVFEFITNQMDHLNHFLYLLIQYHKNSEQSDFLKKLDSLLAELDMSLFSYLFISIFISKIENIDIVHEEKSLKEDRLKQIIKFTNKELISLINVLEIFKSEQMNIKLCSEYSKRAQINA